MTNIFKLGLTGGIGSGKSTVARMLADLGATVLDADAISRSVTAPGGAAIPAIAQAFGPQMIAPDGSMDRAAMRALVFAEPHERQRLEAIVHPLVQQAMAARLAQARAQGAKVAVLDIPLLVESPYWRDQVDAVLVVDCSEATQVARVMERSQLSETAVRSIIASQASREERRAAADWIIGNDGITLEQLQTQVLSISQKLPL
ncbi:MAG: dephospho-CoA kinase [Comamonas sp.]|nr:dephospho-CoA kinase [Comamonas sp.]